MEQIPFRACAEINKDAIRHNFAVIRSHIRPECKILSVIKADAYGHGAVETARMLSDSDYFGVACPEEALTLRAAGIETPTLILGYTPPSRTKDLIRNRLTQCVFSEEYLNALKAEIRPGERLKVHLKIDTGMSRLGFYVRDERTAGQTADTLEKMIRTSPQVDFEGIFTHFTSSEEDRAATEAQFCAFMGVTERLKRKGIAFALRHCANSAATLLYPEYHLDMVRPGLILYGLLPDPGMDPSGETFGLRPAMTLKSTVAQIHHLNPGDTVSYSRTFRTEAPVETATVCIGYADGLRRELSNGAPVLINGHRTRILGRVCMDQCIIDVTGIPAAPGDTVIFFGQDGDERIPTETVAERCGTISYEILCDIGKRIPRIYTGN